MEGGAGVGCEGHAARVRHGVILECAWGKEAGQASCRRGGGPRKSTWGSRREHHPRGACCPAAAREAGASQHKDCPATHRPPPSTPREAPSPLGFLPSGWGRARVPRRPPARAASTDRPRARPPSLGTRCSCACRRVAREKRGMPQCRATVQQRRGAAARGCGAETRARDVDQGDFPPVDPAHLRGGRGGAGAAGAASGVGERTV